MGRLVLMPPIGRRGFDEFPEPPLLVLDQSPGRRPYDLELCYGYWLVSDKMKSLLEEIDAEGVAFVRCETWIQDGGKGPTHWLCDVMPVLDAVDEEQSRVTIEYDPSSGQKIYSMLGGASLAFKRDVVGAAHIWRMRHADDLVICDERIKDACKRAKLKGSRFRDASKI